MLRVITMTAYRRPKYTREVLTALAQCEGIGEWVFLPQVEPGHEDVIQQFREWNACECRFTVNRTRLGLCRNTHEALFRAYQLRAEVIVHLEDDTVPSPDALRYFDWAIRDVLIPDIKSTDGHHILIASGYNKPTSAPAIAQANVCVTRPIFNSWGWGVDLTRLRWMLIHWCFKDPKRFTTPFRRGYHKTRREIFPTLSRIQNIGVEMGENDTIAGRRKHRTPFVADSSTPQQPFTYEKLI